MKQIAVFCGSSLGTESTFTGATIALAECMADADITLIYGGAKVGLMGQIADHMLKRKKKVIGVIPRSLDHIEISHDYLSKLHIVATMHERKALMEELADGFILLPGGIGSLEEFFEMFTWAKLGYHNKPCGILNINNYYDYLLHFLDLSVQKGFLKSVHRDMIFVETSPSVLLEKFQAFQKN